VNAGVWIDHRRSVLVTLTATGEQTTVIVSHVEKHLERGGDSPMKGPYESLQVPADDSRQRALTGELNIYYDTVVAALRSAERLILLGPGEAKVELRKRLERAQLGARVVAIETEDKMSNREIAARVREFFSGAWVPKAPKHGRPNAGLRAGADEL
jgi:hypothetical protein